MQGFDDHGKESGGDGSRRLINDLITRSLYLLGEQDVFHFSFILTQAQGEGGRSRVGDLKKFQKSGDVHLPTAVSIDTLAQIEDDIGFNRGQSFPYAFRRWSQGIFNEFVAQRPDGAPDGFDCLKDSGLGFGFAASVVEGRDRGVIDQGYLHKAGYLDRALSRMVWINRAWLQPIMVVMM
jgi:hypothetical protein